MSTSTPPSPAAEPRAWDPAAPARRRSERRLLAASRPLAWFLLHAVVRNRRDVLRISRLGYVITGVVACREAAVGSVRFRKDCPKSAGALLTQVMGKTALLNMEGLDHVALRRCLQGLFTPKFVNELAFDLEETRGVVGMLLIAGTETTSTALARITSLLHDTRQWKRLQRRRDLLDGAADIEIVKRRAARKVLLPTWGELWVRLA